MYGIPQKVGLVLEEFVEVQSSTGWVAFKEVSMGCVEDHIVVA
jgi:hypothetical protein